MPPCLFYSILYILYQLRSKHRNSIACFHISRYCYGGDRAKLPNESEKYSPAHNEQANGISVVIEMLMGLW